MTKIENEDYEMVPADRTIDAWDIRILKGTFVETVIAFGAVRFDGKKDQMTFNFDVVSSPDPDLSVDNVDLQIEAGLRRVKSNLTTVRSLIEKIEILEKRESYVDKLKEILDDSD